MVSLRSGTDTEDDHGGFEATSSRRRTLPRPASAGKRKPSAGSTRAAAQQLVEQRHALATLREAEDAAGEEVSGEASDGSGADWPLARKMLAALQDLQQNAQRPASSAKAAHKAKKHTSLWHPQGFKGWLADQLAQCEGAGAAAAAHAGDSSEDDEGGAGAGIPANRHNTAAAATGAWQPSTQIPLPSSKHQGAGSRRQGPAGAASGDLDEALLQQAAEKQLTLGPSDKTYERRKALRQAPKTAGRDWFDLPATRIDDKVKRDLRLLRLRAAMDPKRFYKTPDSTKFPTYFQVGTVVEGATEFYSGRMTKRERKTSITEELLADSSLTQQRKRRFGRLQEERQAAAGHRGRKAGYAKLKKRRKAPKH